MQLMEETLPKPTTFTSTKALKDFRTTNKDSPNLQASTSPTNTAVRFNTRQTNQDNQGSQDNRTANSSRHNNSDMICPFEGHQGHKWNQCQTYNPAAQGYRGVYVHPRAKRDKVPYTTSIESAQSHYQEPTDDLQDAFDHLHYELNNDSKPTSSTSSPSDTW